MSETDTLDNEARPERRLFLERRGYMQKRVIDGARLLPIIGLVLFMVPLIWPKATESDVIETSTSTLYIFAVWFALIVVGGFLAQRINAITEPKPQNDDALPHDLSEHVSPLNRPE